MDNCQAHDQLYSTSRDSCKFLQSLTVTVIKLKVINLRFRCNDTCRPFAFARFLDYEKASEAFYTLDGTELGGLRLRVSFAKSSIVTEQDYERAKRCNNDRFNVILNTGRQETGQPWPYLYL